MSLNYLATRFQCTWPWEMLVMLCDGRIVCGCADPYAKRVLGDTRTASVAGDLDGRGRSPDCARTSTPADPNFCGDCPLKRPLEKDEAPAESGRSTPAACRGGMFIECTAACNISCYQACCAPETGITRTRQTGMLDFDLFRRVVDEAGPSLGRIDFFNYGEAFLHKRAVEMCEYIKTRHPHIYLYTSTNGTALTEEQARRLVHSGIDEVTFSIDGATAGELRPVPPAREIRRGDAQPARDGRREAARPGATCRTSTGGTSCSSGTTATRRWREARRLAVDLGIDRLCWEITDHPEDSFSRRFVPGSPAFEAIRRETWDDSNLGNAIPGATPRARIDVRSPLPAVPGIPLRRPSRAGRSASGRASTTSRRVRFPRDATYGRRLVRLGAQLCGPTAPSSIVTLRAPGCRAPWRRVMRPTSPSRFHRWRSPDAMP